MTGKTVLSFQEWEAQSGMNMEPQGAEMGMQAEPMMPSEEVPSHEPVQPGMEIMPVEEPGDPLHPGTAGGAKKDVDGEHPGQKLGPGQARCPCDRVIPFAGAGFL